MKKLLIRSLILTATFFMASCADRHNENSKAMQQVDFSEVTISDTFWTPRLNNNARNTLTACIRFCESSGRIQNFISTAKGEGPHTNSSYDDSDVYKVIEGISYNLVNTPDAELESKADEWIDLIAAAQQEDGYLGTYYTHVAPQDRWNDMNGHEMYCAGHLLEAGIAYNKATGKDKLLKVAQRMVSHMISTFGPDKRDWVPGHEEVELALVKLYEETQDKEYLDFAYWLLEERGHGNGRANVRENQMWSYPTYQVQDKLPARELTTIHGHAVRAMYLFCGMSDLASYMPESGYLEALDRLWNDVVGTRMYITGGIGVSYGSSFATAEGFAAPYELPNYEAYCETCASIGMVLWNHRMGEWKGESKYEDIVERCLYNGVLSGINIDGSRFFYVNPLASHGTHHRENWFACSCCPTNICRLIPSIGNYVYGTSNNTVWVNQYIGNEATFKVGRRNVKVSMESEYPWKGNVSLTFRSSFMGDIRLRIPGWCKEFSLMKNGDSINYDVDRGYAVLSGKWKSGDCISIRMNMPVEIVAADPQVKADEGLRAVQRGPIIYCAEEVDNKDNFFDIRLYEGQQWEVKRTPNLGDVCMLESECEGTPVRLIPYYSWDNREACEMKIWLDYAQ